MMTMSVLATAGPESGVTQLVPIPALNILPPSSDTEAWSRFPSPRPPRRHRLTHPHRSRGRTKKRSDGEQEESSKPRWNGTEEGGVERVKGSATPQGSPSPLPSPLLPPHVEDTVLGPSLDLLLPPSSRISWSRSSSLGRRSRWSLRSLLSRESDWDSCRSP